MWDGLTEAAQGLIDELRDAFGGISGEIHLGGGEPTEAEFRIGENRSLSWVTLGLAVGVGYIWASGRGK